MLAQVNVAAGAFAASANVRVNPYVPGLVRDPVTDVLLPDTAVSPMAEVPAGVAVTSQEYGGVPPEPLIGTVNDAGAVNDVGQAAPAVITSGAGGGCVTVRVHGCVLICPTLSLRETIKG